MSIPYRLNVVHLQVLRAVENHSDLTQRELADKLGVSLGKVYYCRKALIEKGLVKMGNLAITNRGSSHPIYYT